MRTVKAVRIMSVHPTVPSSISDPVNAAILAVSEDRLQGFYDEPFGEIAARSGVPLDTVLERIVAMLRAGTIRRVRQTLMSTNLARGALCAWQVPPEKLDAAFEFMVHDDPFSGHVVIRSDRCGDAGKHLSLVDHAQSSAGLFAGEARGVFARTASAPNTSG